MIWTVSSYKTTAYLDSLAFQEMSYRQQEILKTRTHSSGWILQHDCYLAWLEDKCGLLWIKGKPGSGKSTLMKRIFQELSKNENLQLAFFLHRRGTLLQQTVIGMFRALLYQLLKAVPAVGTEFGKCYQEKSRAQGEANKEWSWQIQELRELFEATVIAATAIRHVVIFVDALDEAGEEPPREIASYLHSLNRLALESGGQLSVCFSCRHYPIVAINTGFEICVEDENREGIDAYITEELSKRLIIETSGANHNDNLTVLQSILSNRASGLFLWAILMTPRVAMQYNDGRSLKRIEHALSNVPLDLDGLFLDILTKPVDDKAREQRLLVIQWISLAERRLSLEELRVALACDDALVIPHQFYYWESKDFIEDDIQMKKLVISLTGGLAETQHGRVQFIHQSVNDFLIKDTFRCLRDPLSSESLVGHGHNRLSRSCINFLKLGEVWNVRKFTLKVYKHLVLINYATMYCFVHAEKAEYYGSLQHDLLQLLDWPSHQFFRNLRRLTEGRSSPRFPYTEGITLMHVSAVSNLQSTMQLLLKNGAQVNETDENGNSPLHYAAQGGHDHLATMLLDSNVNVEAKNKSQISALEQAAAKGHENFVRLLLDRGAEVSSKPGFRDNALYGASLNGSTTLVGLLLNAGADVHTQGGKYGNALQAASYNGKEAVVRLLLAAGANVNAQGGEYGNALQAASWIGSEEAVRLLLERGANVNAQGGEYGNALQAASYGGHEAVVRLLLEEGANVNARGGTHDTALQAMVASRLCQLEGDRQGWEGMISMGEADVNDIHPDPDCDEHDRAIVRLLLENGAQSSSKEASWLAQLGLV